AGKLPPIPIYVDSPMAAKATEVFHSHPECFDADMLHLLKDHPEVFGAGRVCYIEKVHDSIALNKHVPPSVITSPSALSQAGPIPSTTSRIRGAPSSSRAIRPNTRSADGSWSVGRRCGFSGGSSK